MKMKQKFNTYTVLFERLSDGMYIASVPMLPGCMTQGSTFEKAKEYIKDAISAYLVVLKEDGDEAPIETTEHIAATIAVPLAY